MDHENDLAKIREEIEAVISSRSLPKERRAIGFFCPYVPEELLHAAGYLPFRLMGTPIEMSRVQAHLPSNCCHLVKSSLESLLRGELDSLEGVVFTHTCDSMQGLSDIWAHQGRLSIHFNLMIPSNLNSEHSRPYLKAEIKRFQNFLESRSGRITPESLKASIQLFNRIRERMRNLYTLRQKKDLQLPEGFFARLIRAGYLMDRSRYLDLLNQLLDGVTRRSERDENLIPVYLSGNMVHSDSYFSLIEEAGATVVRDDLCSGARTLRLMVPENPDPLEALTQRYFTSFFCPTKHTGHRAHIETLLEDVEQSGARGVIFLLYKYCEAHYFDYPDLKAALESKGIPTLLLDVEDPDHSLGQLKIRIQAFVEMLHPF
ncbi:MAG: 2-hydroxyacyl-CoA dehydratase [Syntrophaceae bacterium]|nr:2-hydroxyacyl-CoA dehydratase [Syntrophaceae bacterium]